MLYDFEVMESNYAGTLYRNVVDRRCSRSRATNVERAHRQLGSRFADGLRRDHAHRLPDIDRLSTRQIPSITGCTHTEPCLTRNR